MHVPVIVEVGHVLAQPRAHRLQGAARRQGRMEIAALRRGQQLDPNHGERVLGHAQQPPGAMGGHGDMVLLVGGGGDGVHAGRIGLLLVLRHQGGGGHLGDHEAGVEARLGSQEGRQAGQRRIDQHGDPALGQGADLADSQSDHVGGEGHGFGVEVAAGKRLRLAVFALKNQGVVGDTVGLVLKRPGGLAQDAQSRAHDLGLATQAVGILHPLVVLPVRGADGRAGHQAAQGRRDIDLPGMAAQGVDARIERGIRPLGRLGGEGAGDQGRLEQPLGLEQAGQGVGGGELGAIEQSQALLRAELQRS